MDSLGHRAQAWEGGANTSFTSSRRQHTTPGNGHTGGGDLFAGHVVSDVDIVQPLGLPWFGSSSTSQTPQKKIPSSTQSSLQDECERIVSTQLPLLREHAEAVRMLHMIDQSEDRDANISINSVPTPCRDFLIALPHSAAQSFLQFDIRGENDLKGYKFLLELIAAMTGEGQPPPGRNKPGYFSPVVLTNHQEQSSSRELRERREWLSTGAREHLENDYRDGVIKPESAAYMRNVSGNGNAYDRMGGLEATPDFELEDATVVEEVQRYVSAILPTSHHNAYGSCIELDDDGVLFWPQVKSKYYWYFVIIIMCSAFVFFKISGLLLYSHRCIIPSERFAEEGCCQSYLFLCYRRIDAT
jgi:hypothetical protein